MNKERSHVPNQSCQCPAPIRRKSEQVLEVIRNTEVVRPIRNRHRYNNPTFSSQHKFPILPSSTAPQLQPKVNQHSAEVSVLPGQVAGLLYSDSLISEQCKCPRLHGLDVRLITKCKTVPKHAMQAHKGSGGVTHTLSTWALDSGEWSASRLQRNLNPRHFLANRNPLNPSVLRCLYLSCGHHRTSNAALSKYTAPVIIYASHCNKRIFQDATLKDTHRSSSVFIHSAGSRW